MGLRQASVILVVWAVTAAGAGGCKSSTAVPTTDPALAALSAQAQDELAPSADVLVPVSVVLEAMRAGVPIEFVDARTKLDYDNGHIPGAVNVPYFDPQPYMASLPKDKLIVCYCQCPHAEAVQVADALQANGFPWVKAIDEGLDGWTAAGGEVVASATSVLFQRNAALLSWNRTLQGAPPLWRPPSAGCTPAAWGGGPPQTPPCPARKVD
jgi:rhodanese-related sulfurtransferase